MSNNHWKWLGHLSTQEKDASVPERLPGCRGLTRGCFSFSGHAGCPLLVQMKQKMLLKLPRWNVEFKHWTPTVLRFWHLLTPPFSPKTSKNIMLFSTLVDRFGVKPLWAQQSMRLEVLEAYTSLDYYRETYPPRAQGKRFQPLSGSELPLLTGLSSEWVLWYRLLVYYKWYLNLDVLVWNGIP